ncbi:MAG: twin-arginine translocase TatA/TatE family subunit [Kiritimatiellae bacterium]|nr:twin-arginine translocase TatA/TatE family subunit [Kiritimatiellia bacterium]
MSDYSPLGLLFDSAGIGEWAVLGVVALIVYGPHRLPAMARQLGRLLSRLQQAADLFRLQLMSFEKDVEEQTKQADQPDRQARPGLTDSPDGGDEQRSPTEERKP